MIDVGDWLNQLGLADFAESFEENGVDGDLLPELTNEDLKDLGIARLVDRKKLLRAIATLGPGEDGLSANQPTAMQQIAPQPAVPPAAAAERRQLTVMFCDLVGSTELSNQFDPEVLRELIISFQDVCREAIQSFNGFIARYMGDGILVYFGYPHAYEDSAERAVRAGLAIVQSLKDLNTELAGRYGADLAVRIGVATGPVVVGDIVGEGAAEEAAVVGKTPNLAARLQGAAQPNEMVVASSTQHLSGDQFEYDDLGEHSLKGIVEPVRIWRVVGERNIASRLGARPAGGSIPLIGRKEEFETLQRAWKETKMVCGQAILVEGEAGIGKSRICEALEESIAGESHYFFRLQCSPFHANSNLHPVAEQLRNEAGITAEDSAESSLDKLQSQWSEFEVQGVPAAALLAPLLSIPTGERYTSIGLSPARLKTLTFDTILERVTRISNDRPLALVFEDAHWIDPTTLELLDLLVQRIGNLRVLLLITHRPDFEFNWQSKINIKQMMLGRLDTAEVTEMVTRMVVNNQLPQSQFDEILAKTDGIPLFVEELTKMLLERAESSPASNNGRGYKEDDTEIPTSIHDLLLARLDQLGPIKQLAQQAACLGRTFSQNQLMLISGLSTDDLAPLLSQLVELGLTIPAEDAPGEYTFRHALVQETAYSSLLHVSRIDIHKRAAIALEDRIAETEPEILAHHFGRAQMYGKEIHYRQRAGLKAMSASAFVEAISHFRNAIAQLERLPVTDRVQLDLELHLQIAVPLTMTLGWAAIEVGEAYERANELCKKIEESTLIFPVLHGILRYYLVTGNHRKAEEIAVRDLERAEQSKDDGLILEFALHPGVVYFYTGRLARALPHLERSISLYDVDLHRDHTETYAACPATIGLAHMAIAQAIFGRPDEAFASNLMSARHADLVSHRFSQVWAMSNHAMNHILYEDPGQCAALAKTMIAVAAEQEFVNWLSQGRVWLGWSMVQSGEVEAGLEHIRSGIDIWEMTGAILMRPFYFTLLADCFLKSGDVEQAHQAINQSLDIMKTTGEHWTKPLTDIIAIHISLARNEISNENADGRLHALADEARARGEWLWVVKAERRRLLNAQAAGRTADGAPLADALSHIEHQGDYPMLNEAAKLAANPAP
jgi:class 3 adenylate cyclase/predicted ATPase